MCNTNNALILLIKDFSVKTYLNLSKKNFMKNFGLGDQLLLKFVFENFDFQILYFLKLYPIFVGYVQKFGKSDNDMIK